jgi:hypothetical protein
MGDDTLDEAPWIAGHLRPTQPPVELFRRHGDHEIPIGTMLTPELAAQVVAEHRHAVEFRAMMRDAGQRHSERSTQGPDSPAAIAAWAGYVPLADVLDALRDHDGFVEWTRTQGPGGYTDEYARSRDREIFARYLAERFTPAPEGER